MSTEALEIARGRALHFLQAGMLTQTEAAKLAGVSRQRMHQWVMRAGIKAVNARDRHLKGLWNAYSGHSDS